MSNVVYLKAYRTLKECDKLFVGYRARVEKMDRDTLLLELERYKQEAQNYPHHLLTVVKGEILMGAAKTVAVSPELRAFASREEIRLKEEVRKRLHQESDTATGRSNGR